MSKTEMLWLQVMHLLVRYTRIGTYSRKSVLVTATIPTLFSFSRKLVFNKQTYSYMNTVNIQQVGAANNYVTSACKSHTFCQNITMIHGKILKWRTEHRSPSGIGYVNRHFWKQVTSLPSVERREPADLCTCLLCSNFFLKAVGR